MRSGEPRPAPGAGRALLGALLALAGAAAGCARGGGEAIPLAPGTPVVLISIDTLRSDRLPAYGYLEVETPAIDALARGGVVFDHAYCHVPLTLPSHVSIFTGLLPPEHGVRDNLGYRFESAGRPYLPRLLRRHGYRTGAAVSSFVLRGASGLASGFELYEDAIRFPGWAHIGEVQRPGEETLARAREWLRTVAEEPFFLFFHLYEPHAPYEPPEPFASRYRDPYDGEVAAADAVVGELLADLQELGLYERALILLLSDHGEGLGDHGDQEHGPLLYREVLQVPLILKLPGSRRGGCRVERPVQLVDVLPTLTELLGIPTPEGLPGASLLAPDPAATGRRPIYAETYFPRLAFGWSELFSLIDFPHHLIDGPDPELYDLAADPGERRNLLRERRRAFASLRQELRAIEPNFHPPAAADPETRRKLAALGYLGGGGEPGEGPLPDPKAHLGVLGDLRQGVEAFNRGEYESAAGIFRGVLAGEPGLVMAWEYLGHCHLRQGRLQEALAAYREGLELGGAPHLAAAAGGVFLELGRLEEAEDHARLAVPAHPAAYDLLAQIALRRGDLEAAEDHLEAALEARGGRLQPLITQAELLVEQGRHQEALEAIRRVEEDLGRGADPEALRGLYFTKGRAYAGLAETSRAAEAFRREIEISPRELAPYAHLAFVYALEGRAAEAGAALRRMVEANPTPRAYAEAVRTLRAMKDFRSAAAVLERALKRWPESPELRELASG